METQEITYELLGLCTYHPFDLSLLLSKLISLVDRKHGEHFDARLSITNTTASQF